MKTPKEKDSVLNAFYYGTKIDYIASKEVIDILIADGYVENIRYADGNFNKITDKGKGFILQGGYTEQDKSHKSQKRFTLKMNAMSWIVTIIASILSAMGGFILSKLTQ